MIPEAKLFEIIKYAGQHGFNTQIFGNFGTIEFSMYDREMLRYNWQDPNIKYIKTDKVNEEESEYEIPLYVLIETAEYYSELVKIANMLQESIVMENQE